MNSTSPDKPAFEKPDWDTWFLLQSEIVRLRSSCLTRQVGCVVTKDNRIISSGYNGILSGLLDCNKGGCERCSDRVRGLVKSGQDLDRCLCAHAEQNAMTSALKFGQSFEGATAYITLSPCIDCQKLLCASGVTKIVTFDENYAESDQGLRIQKGVDHVKMNRKTVLNWLDKLTKP